MRKKLVYYVNKDRTVQWLPEPEAERRLIVNRHGGPVGVRQCPTASVWWLFHNCINILKLWNYTLKIGELYAR